VPKGLKLLKLKRCKCADLRKCKPEPKKLRLFCGGPANEYLQYFSREDAKNKKAET
jgi:hypothetical protein